MLKYFLFFIFLFNIGISNLCGTETKLFTTDGIINYSDGRRSMKNLFQFPGGIFIYSKFWRQADAPEIIQLGFKEGTFGHFHWIRPSYFWSPDGKTEYPEPTELWFYKNPDGSSIGQISLPAFSKNVKGIPSSFSYRFCFLEKYPQWMFLKVTLKGVNTALTFKCDAGWTEFVPPNHQGAARHLMLNDKHYMINGPKKLPNDEAFNSFILYASNSAKLSHDMSVLLFEPNQADLISLRSMSNSTMAFLFSIRAKKSGATDSSLTFALGNFTVDNGETAAENFYKTGESKKIRQVMKDIDWDNVFLNTDSINAEIKKGEKLIQEIKSSGKSISKEKLKELNSLRIKLEQSEKNKDYNTFFATFRKLKKFNRLLTEKSLELLLEKN